MYSRDGSACKVVLRIKRDIPDRIVYRSGVFLSFPGRAIFYFYLKEDLMKGKSCIRCLLAGFLLWAPTTFAQADDNAEPAVSKSDTMVVTAGRLEEKKEDVTANVTIVTGIDIRESGAQDLGELLAKEGFMIREYPNSLVSVGVRGFRTETHGNDLSSHVLILINGRRAGTGNLAKILVDNVERVEIVRGPGSVQYGASAMGGVVNVITKQGKGKPAFEVGQTLGSYDYLKTAASGSVEISDFDFSFSASTESQDDYTTADSVTYYNTGFDSKDRISFNAGYSFLPKNRIGISFSSYDGDGIGSPDRLAENDLDNYVNTSIRTTDVTYDGQTDNGFMIWNLRYFSGKDEYETFGDSYYFRDTDQQGAQGQFTVNWDHAHVTTGFDWTHYEISNSYSIPGGENTYDNPAGFLLAKIKLMDDSLVLSAGGRQDSYEVESDEGESTDETNWSSSLGAIYKFAPGISVRVNYAEAFKMPTADELYMFDDYSAWGFGIYSGNANLKPEESKTWEIGMDAAYAAFSGSLTYFQTTFDNKIDTVYIPEESLTTYENLEGAEISGFEGTLDFDFGAHYYWTWELAPYASFTYLTERKDESTGEDLQYTPEWTASYGLRFANPEKGFTSRLNLSYTSEQDITDYAGTGDPTSKAVTVADLTVSKTLFSFQKTGEIVLNTEIRNLFNEDYDLVQGYPAQGRSFFVNLKYVY